MLNHISWAAYLEIILLLLAIYYVIVGLRFYKDDIRRIFQHAKTVTGVSAIPDALRYEGPEEVSYPLLHPGSSDPDNRPDHSPAETDGLIRDIKACIGTASGKPFAPAVLIPQIKKLFRANPGLRNSPYRPAINELVVTECEREGTALLTEDEVDQWWSD